MKIFNFNLLCDIVGILGFLLSVINAVYFYVIRRKKLKIRFEEFGVCNYYSEQILKIRFCFQNLSQLPISITKIQLLVNNDVYDCTNSPVQIEEIIRKKNGVIYDTVTVNSVSVPVNLQPLTACGDYFAFPISQGILSNSEKVLSFRIYTNRGKVIQKTFLQHEDVICR